LSFVGLLWERSYCAHVYLTPGLAFSAQRS